MTRLRTTGLALGAALWLLSGAAPAAEAPAGGTAAPRPYDVLDLPAEPSALAEKSLVFSLTRAGGRIVATGIRGHVLLSDDDGRTWIQAESVPVRTALLDASFPTPETGWAVGHDGVILHSRDGGRTWVRQADGRGMGAAGAAYYRERQADDPANPAWDRLLEEMAIYEEAGAERPLFRVAMRDERTGIAAGAYGLLLRTDDGGASWRPVMEAVGIEDFVHLFDIVRLPAPVVDAAQDASPVLPEFAIGGEMGTVLVPDPAEARWRPVELPYEGSMFTLLAAGDRLVAGGLRGRVFVSSDGGASWREPPKPESGSIVASALLADGRIVLGAENGALFLSTDRGDSFVPVPVQDPHPLSDIIEGRPGELVLAGAAGVGLFPLPP